MRRREYIRYPLYGNGIKQKDNAVTHIYADDGFLYRTSDWDTKYNAHVVGIGLQGASNLNVIASLNFYSYSDETPLFTSNPTGILRNGGSSSYTDGIYDGYQRSMDYIKKITYPRSTKDAFCLCYNLKLPYGAVGYLPSISELYRYFTINTTSLNTTINKVTDKSVNSWYFVGGSSSANLYYSSTLGTATNEVWAMTSSISASSQNYISYKTIAKVIPFIKILYV